MNHLEQIDRWVEAHRHEFLEDAARLIAVPSKRGPAEEGRPFGREPARALDMALEMCRKYGFSTKNYEYYAGAADFGSASPCLDILAHLDVVDEGNGWDTDPFTLVEKDGILYGRGIADDKGPALAALYAMRAVRDLGIPLRGNVRLILGTDEESGSHDLPYYFAREASAPNSFSPDSDFPVYNTEKGRCRPHFTKSFAPETALPRVASIHGGNRINIVADEATALVLGLTAADASRLCAPAAAACGVQATAAPAEGGAEIRVNGTSGHGSTPHLGNNAITALLAILETLPLADLPSTQSLRFLHRLFPHGDTGGDALGVAMADEISGPLTMSFNLLSLENGVLDGACDGRTPLCATRENCHQVAAKRFAQGGFQTDIPYVPSHHVPEDSAFVQTLLASYEAVTGQKGWCIAGGGGTYVHNIEGGVAFGPVMPGVQTNMHGANESIPLADLLTACKIFALVIAEVCR